MSEYILKNIFREIFLSLLLDLRQIAISHIRKIQAEDGSQSTPEIYPSYLVKRREIVIQSTIYFRGQRLCGPSGKSVNLNEQIAS